MKILMKDINLSLLKVQFHQNWINSLSNKVHYSVIQIHFVYNLAVLWAYSLQKKIHYFCNPLTWPLHIHTSTISLVQKKHRWIFHKQQIFFPQLGFFFTSTVVHFDPEQCFPHEVFLPLKNTANLIYIFKILNCSF